jgi:hypothetical protein
MSRGPGRLQRLIADTLAGNPGSMFSIEALARIAYPEAGETTRSHRVAVRRAADHAAGVCGWRSMRSRSLEYYNPLDVRSAALATMRATWKRVSRCPIAEIEAALDDPKRPSHKLIEPGGPVWLDVEIALADRDGEVTRVEALQRQRDKADGVADMAVLVEESRLIARMAAVRRRRSDIFTKPDNQVP